MPPKSTVTAAHLVVPVLEITWFPVAVPDWLDDKVAPLFIVKVPVFEAPASGAIRPVVTMVPEVKRKLLALNEVPKVPVCPAVRANSTATPEVVPFQSVEAMIVLVVPINLRYPVPEVIFVTVVVVEDAWLV